MSVAIRVRVLMMSVMMGVLVMGGMFVVRVFMVLVVVGGFVLGVMVPVGRGLVVVVMGVLVVGCGVRFGGRGMEVGVFQCFRNAIDLAVEAFQLFELDSLRFVQVHKVKDSLHFFPSESCI